MSIISAERFSRQQLQCFAKDFRKIPFTNIVLYSTILISADINGMFCRLPDAVAADHFKNDELT